MHMTAASGVNRAADINNVNLGLAA